MMNRQKNWIRLVPWLLVLLWMGVIFYFSQENGEQSAGTSERVICFLLTRFDPGFLDLTAKEQTLRIRAWSTVVRKMAHFTLFGVMGLLSFGAFSVVLPPRRAFWAALGLGMLQGILDEVHQLFVPGRACEIRDMAIDTAGVALGVLVMLLLFSLVKRKKEPKTGEAQ